MKWRPVIGCIMLLHFSMPHAQTGDADQPVESQTSVIQLVEPDQTKDECAITGTDDTNWVDKLHGYLNTSLCTPAVWFDGFFSKSRIDEEVRPGSNIRWQYDFIEDETGESRYAWKIRGSFKLPRASQQTRLLFESEPDNTAASSDSATTTSSQSLPRFGLLFGIKKTPRANLNIRLTLHPGITMRYRYSQPVTDSFTTQFTQQFFRENSVNGSSSQVDFIQSFSPALILRQSNQVRNTADNPAAEWSSSLVLFQRLSGISALSYESGYNGVNRPKVFATNIRLAVRYRRQFYRQWLFYEVAPEVTWPRQSLEEKRRRIAALFLRLEVNFVNL